MRRLLTRRRFLAATAATASALGLYTWRVEPHWVEWVQRTLPIHNLPQELVGARLVQLSDLHVGPQVDDEYLLQVLDRVRDLAPEIVVYTGDFANYNADFSVHGARVLLKLACGSLGTYGILGNHDYGHGWHDTQFADSIISLAESAGVQILRNESANVQGLTIVGLDELWADRFEPNAVLPGLNPSAASLVLVHNPDAVDRVGWDSYSGWILAGHTHGGQCKPPFLPPPRIPVRNLRYTSGEFELAGDRRLYINRGIGHLMRVRFNARPEVTCFQLTTG